MRKRKPSLNKSSKKREGPYNLPNQEDLDKLAAEIKKHRKRLNDDGSLAKQYTQSQLMGLIRGAIREQWMYSPVKLAYLLERVEPDNDPLTRRRFKVQCEHCKEYFTKAQVQVDHIIGEHSLRTIEDFEKFVESILYVKHEGLQILCEDCHDLKTAMERYNLTKEEAEIFKKVLNWEKINPKAAKQKELLISYGFKPADASNSDKRRQAALQHFKENN